MSNLQANLDGITRREKIEMILRLLAHEAKRNSPDEFRAFVVGLLANCFNTMPDSTFDQFCSVHRCEHIGCDCHVVAEAATGFFKLLREDIRKDLSRREQRRN